MANPNSQTSTPLQNLSSNQSLRLIAYAKAISANAVADTVMPTINTAKYSVLYVMVTGATVSLAQAHGALYTAPAAAGTAIVSDAALSGATGPTIVVQHSIASTAVATTTNLYYRVGTVNTAASVFDVYVYGFCFD
jgi:hypothetical protein